MESGEGPTRLNRRDALTIGGAAVINCLFNKRTNAAKADSPSTPAQGSEQVVVNEGTLNAEYSDFIKKYDLQPRVLTELPKPTDKLAAGTRYITKFAEAIRLEKLMGGVVLDSYHMQENNFPILLPKGSDTTIFDVVEAFDDDLSNGRLSFGYDQNFTGLLGTVAYPIEKDGKLYYNYADITAGPFIQNGVTISETPELSYTDLTDADLSVTMLHEYGHAMQLKEIFNRINALPEAELAEIGVDFQKFWDKVGAISDVENERVIAFTGADSDVHTNEAQANAIMEMYLLVLNGLNGQNHMVGTGFVDPTPSQIQQTGWENLYTEFEQIVLTDPNGSLSRDWQNVAGK